MPDRRKSILHPGGSEADNWAVKGVAEAYGKYGRHIITSRIEHHAVLNSCHYLEEQGYEVTYLDVDQNGMISLEQLEQAVREDTILISVMFGNNEVGTIEPVMQIGRFAKRPSDFVSYGCGAGICPDSDLHAAVPHRSA